MSDVLDYEFPVVTKIDLAFPTMGAPKELVEMARERGFRDMNSRSPASKLFSAWFFRGLSRMPDFKPGVDKDKAQRAMNWAACFIGSWEPKHEDKEAVCALIFDAALDLSDIDSLLESRP